MDFEEFQVYFWSYIPENIVSNLDRSVNNRDFCESLCYDAYRLFTQSNVDIDIICKSSENMLFNVLRFKPILGLKD